ncbi:hypothetical protein BT93_D0104 [Corymbia citriodora subsp. variegata]|nr:hypothetical protein BT93_D0104 [Corymbia citriodora subsp. variegata]KAF8030809.1 hypothetical protein BT93_D0104 [Corymbia citriodora subsp. variegata]
MDFASPLLELVKGLWGLASKPLGHICNLKDNVDALRNATRDLKAMSRDVKARVECEEGGGGARRTNQVENWLDKVQEFEGGVDQVLQEAGERDQIKCLYRCLPWNCWSSYKSGKRVDQLLNEAREPQHEKGEFSDFTIPLPPPPVLAMPMDETMGLDMTLGNMWKWLLDEKRIGMIGLYGTGGVGKTTLMKRINNELSRTNHGFKVIWVVVSKQVNEDNIRDAIRKGLNIRNEIWEEWPQDERVHHLLEVLTQKKFALLIDDVWARLDLSKIGVPLPSLKNGSKVVFTTRSEQVCYQMGADKAHEIKCLMPREAMGLFEKNVGESTINFHPEIPELAKDIVQECKGLPLALITVGRAMVNRKKPSEWNHVLRMLRNNPYKLSGMDEVYHILEFSYNSLNDTTTQLCFLYCCLFPEDYLMRPHNLIELWIGEGLLGDTNDVYNMREKGEYVLETLKMACLLERGCDFEGEYVKMHDVIRDMATWIAHDYGQRENKLLVIQKEEDMSVEKILKWREAEKLETLFVRKTKVRLMPRGFFDSMRTRLTVLDLFGNSNIGLFPEGICDLINLQYLNLSSTRISELPSEIKNLTHLRWLLLNYTSKTFLIPTGAIASLPLNVFDMWRSGLEKEEEMVEELGRRQDLTDLSIIVYKSFSALKIFKSFQRCIRRVGIIKCDDLTCIPISRSLNGSGNFLHLEVFYLIDCPMHVKMEIAQGIRRAPDSSCFPNLIEVRVENCGLLDLSWLMHAPKLRNLTVLFCFSMEKIIGDGIAREELAASRLFSRLESLVIINLTQLRSICDHALFIPQGVEFHIRGCHYLRKLPLDSNSTRGSFSIIGDKDWWAKFEWDPAARVTMDWPHMSPEVEMTFGEAASK